MKKARIIIDTLMVALLPLLMAYSLIGEDIHEILGICMFVLFKAHNVINRKWWTSIFKGKYNSARFLNTAVNLLLVVFIFCRKKKKIPKNTDRLKFQYYLILPRCCRRGCFFSKT